MLPNNRPYLIGETAAHHEGDLEFLKELVHHAAELKCDAIKFHMLIDLDDYMVADHEVIDIIRPWCYTESQWESVIDTALHKGLDVVVLCNDEKSIDWCLKTNKPIQAIEIHATGINDYFLLNKAAQFNGTVILGTGGSTVDDIHYAVSFLKARGQADIFLMHGFQNYPTKYEDINLAKMQQWAELFQLPVGYADHTDPTDEDNEMISVLGLGMGFNVLEKHFTHHFGKKRIDAQSAVSLKQMQKIRRLMDKVFASFGDKSMKMSEGEKKYGNTGPLKKAIVARANIPANTVLGLEHIAFKRTNEGTYIKQNLLSKLLGLTTTQPIQKDTFIDFSKVNYKYKSEDFSQFNNSKKV